MNELQRANKIGQRYLNPVETSVGDFSIVWKTLPLYLRNKEEKFPKITPGPFTTDPAVYANAPASGLRVTWFGHSSALIEIDGVRLLFDPVWDERAAPVQWGGPKRFFPPTIPLEALPHLDAVIVSHDHYDHLGAGTIRSLAKLHPNLRWITALGVGRELRKFGVPSGTITELDWTESAQVAGISLTAVPARHFSGRSLFNRFHTLWASFALRGPAHAVYFGADSGEWDGFAAIGAEHGPFDLTMLEIGAYHELWKQIHMGPDGAGRSFQAMGGTGLLMPMHWGLFDLALHAWRQPIERMTEVADAEGIALWSPEPGLPTEVVGGSQIRSDWWRQPAGR